jgi:uncharacterized phiE125 gp8 family phage protein
VAVSSKAIIDLADAREHLPNVLASEERYVELLIDAATARVESVCQRPFVAQDFTETYRPAGDTIIRLYKAPVVSIAEVKEYETVLESLYYDLDAEAGLLYRLYGRWPGGGSSRRGGESAFWQEAFAPNAMGLAKVTVKYKAGYGERKDVPADIKQACRLLVATWFYNRDSTVESSVAGMRTSYALSAANQQVPNNVMSLLEPYIRGL